jgi:glycosyltransferase 2 family protein
MKADAPARNSRLKRLLVYAIAVACLVWVFHDVHPRRLLATMSIENWWFVALAVLVDILTYVLQGMRWRLLLLTVGDLGTMRATQGIYAGLFTNEVVPLRFGELVRAFLASRWLSRPITAILPSMVVERFLDALWLALGIGVAAILVPLPRNLLEAGDVLGAIVLIATVLFLWIVFRKKRELEHRGSPPGVLTGVAGFIARLAGGLRDIGISRRFYLSALLSAGMLACQALAVWFMMLACGIRLPLETGFIVLLIVRLGTAIPNAPANVGSFQFFTVLALGLFGIDKTVAAAFSIIYFVALTAPLWIIGLWAISRTGMSLSTIRLRVADLRRNSAQI